MAITAKERAVLREEIEKDPAGMEYDRANPWGVFNKLRHRVRPDPDALRNPSRLDVLLPELLEVCLEQPDIAAICAEIRGG